MGAAMATDTEAIFCEVAQELGFLTPEQIAECKKALVLITSVGGKTSLTRLILDKDLLTRGRIAAIQREMQRRGVRPRIAGYELLEKLGEGGMGTVYKARQVSLDRIVALKLLPVDLARNRGYIERFQREALLAARLSHPNAVQVFNVGEEAGRHYIAMELVEGESVARALREGLMPERRALAIVRGVAQALGAAHERGIIHRDIKPSNILLTPDDEPKLADLGIAKQLGASGQTLTKSGVALGTPAYMSPEQCRGEKQIDGRTDIYSLGATLFHMVCGRPPFQAETGMAVMHMHAHESLPEPRSFNPNLSQGTARLIRRMMERDRGNRFQTCAALVEAIDRIPQQEPAATPERAVEAEPPAPTPASLAEDEAFEEQAPALATPRRWPAGLPRVSLPVVGLIVIVLAAILTLDTIIAWRAERREATPPKPKAAPLTSSPVQRTAARIPQRIPEAKAPPKEAKAKAVPDTARGPAPPTPAPVAPAAKEPPVRLPPGWTAETKRVTVATPEGDIEKEITYYTNTIGMAFVLIPAGEFMMGGEDGPPDERPVHRVAITQAFLMGAHEVTQEQYEQVVGRNQSRNRSPKNPVENLAWTEALEFCKRLSTKEGSHYRLPTEAEWEYACRAGSKTKYYWGDRFRNDCAWRYENSGGKPHKVGQKVPNQLGLFDMSGNVWDWCQTIRKSYPYRKSDGREDIKASGSRVLRGGSRLTREGYQRSACRHAGNNASGSHGFRVVVLLPEVRPEVARVPPALLPKKVAGGKKDVSHTVPPWAKVSQEQIEAGGRDGVSVVKEVDIGGATLRMVYIPPGEFIMGSPATELGRATNEGPQHRVTIPKGYYMSIHETTVGQYRAFVRQTGYKTYAERRRGTLLSRKGAGKIMSGRTWKSSAYARSVNHPVTCLTWYDARTFCDWLAKETGENFRLPTEPEWEYACRAGVRNRFHTGKTEGYFFKAAWCARNSEGKTHPVGLRRQNRRGLYDMHGNVWEWCLSLYRPYPYHASDGREDVKAEGERVLRGGGWASTPQVSRSAARNYHLPDQGGHAHGFRAVCVPSPEP